MRAPSFYLGAVLDLVRAWRIEPEIERSRLREGPVPLLDRLRREASVRRARDLIGRDRLRAMIAVAERLRRRKPNCYRRVLMEVALDAGAAREQVFLALDSEGGVGSGHAYLQSHREALEKSYDILFAV